jgi:hypothetical protein
MRAEHNPGRAKPIRIITFICVGLMLFVGIIQAVHVHTENSKLPSHECSVCSVAHAGIIRNAVQNPVPIFVHTESVSIAAVASKSAGVILSFRIRPPPAV